ncbi:MAG: efflux RND transporter periplasmic adaptor subunit [Colwellia sp.]|nr:efflux RND transporter periplasmic adaptor subunit [Colwellia sp.]
MRDTSGQDVQIEQSGLKKPLVMKALIAVALIAAFSIFVLPKFNNMFSSDLTIAKERLRFAIVEQGNLQRDIGVQGKIVAANSPTLYATAPGIVSLFIKAGDTVEKGQILAEVNSPQLNNRYAQELATLEQLDLAVGRHKIEIKTTQLNDQQAIEMSAVNLEAARVNKERAETSIQNSLISKKEHEEKMAEFKRASLSHQHAKQSFDLQKESMEFELKSKQSQLGRQQYVVDDLKRQVRELTLLAPTAGIIGSVNIREKDSVPANTSLITVIDLSAFEVEVNIPESFADDLGVGLASEISFNGETHQGQIIAISPEVTNGQVVGRLRFNEDVVANLRQNQRVSARILIESKENILKIRRGAFVESGGGRIVYLVNNDNAIRKKVTLGARSIGEIEVVSGLKVGDKIVISSIDIFNNHEQIYLTN